MTIKDFGFVQSDYRRAIFDGGRKTAMPGQAVWMPMSCSFLFGTAIQWVLRWPLHGKRSRYKIRSPPHLRSRTTCAMISLWMVKLNIGVVLPRKKISYLSGHSLRKILIQAVVLFPKDFVRYGDGLNPMEHCRIWSAGDSCSSLSEPDISNCRPRNVIP